jgi:hypothetical protein
MEFLHKNEQYFAIATIVMEIRSYICEPNYIRNYWVVMGITKPQELYSLYVLPSEAFFSGSTFCHWAKEKGKVVCVVQMEIDEYHFAFI